MEMTIEADRVAEETDASPRDRKRETTPKTAMKGRKRIDSRAPIKSDLAEKIQVKVVLRMTHRLVLFSLLVLTRTGACACMPTRMCATT